jgi:hypothetical protein
MTAKSRVTAPFGRIEAQPGTLCGARSGRDSRPLSLSLVDGRCQQVPAAFRAGSRPQSTSERLQH